MNVDRQITLDGFAPTGRAGLGVEVLQQLGFRDGTEASCPAADYEELGPNPVLGVGHVAHATHRRCRIVTVLAEPIHAGLCEAIHSLESVRAVPPQQSAFDHAAHGTLGCCQ